MNYEKEKECNNEFEKIFKDRKLKHEHLRRKNSKHNKFILPLLNLIKKIINFLKTTFNI
ncbi:selenoprotein, putative, partial [Plasmodium gallinaceum]